jgi:uncharacterized protein (DUF362 family)
VTSPANGQDSGTRHRRLDRRTFLAGAGVASIAAVSAGTVLRTFRRPDERWDAHEFAPPGEAHVAVVPATTYDRGLEALVGDGLAAIGADVSGAKVVLKPNFVEYDPGTAINTDPRLVAAAVMGFRRLGAASVIVAEGPGHRRDTQYVTARSGLLEELRDVDAPYVDLNVDAVRRRPLHSRYTQLGELWLPATIVEADIVVSMPKMKTHHWAGVTLSLKNCFGCVPGRVYGYPKNALHWAGLQQSILDVSAAVRPRYAIVDGIVGMHGNGPISGSAIDAGVVVFGDDAVATDVIAATLMGATPESIPYLAEAGRFLGQADRDRIVDVAEDPETLAVPFEPAPGLESTSG